MGFFRNGACPVQDVPAPAKRPRYDELGAADGMVLQRSDLFLDFTDVFQVFHRSVYDALLQLSWIYYASQQSGSCCALPWLVHVRGTTLTTD